MSNLRVVLADDHEVVRAGLRGLVDATPGMEVVGEAANGAEALEEARALGPDVLVMDISMPVLDGVLATQEIASSCPAVKVLVLTAHEDRAHLLRLLQAGAAGYVVKRAAVDELVRAIRIVAGGGTYVDPELAGMLLRARATRASSPPLEAPEEGENALSAREEEVLRGIAWGHSNKIVAADLGISTKTVETYRARIAEKLGLRSRTEMVRYALQKGWLSES